MGCYLLTAEQRARADLSWVHRVRHDALLFGDVIQHVSGEIDGSGAHRGRVLGGEDGVRVSRFGDSMGCRRWKALDSV